MRELVFQVFNMNDNVPDNKRMEASFRDFESAFEFCNLMVENGVYNRKPVILDFEAYLKSEDNDWWFVDNEWTNFVNNDFLNKQYPANLEDFDSYIEEIRCTYLNNKYDI